MSSYTAPFLVSMGAYGGAVATCTGQETESRPVNSHPQVYSTATVYFSME